MTRPPLKKVLIVEDDPDIQTIARMALEMVGGFTVDACNSGTEALGKALEFAPDIVLLDVMMPGMDGPNTLLALRANEEVGDIPVVFVTAKIQKDEKAKLLELGALDVIEKPFDPMTLSDKVREIWDR